MTKTIKIILIISAIIIIIAVLGVAFWPKQNQPSNTNQPVTVEPDNNQPATTTEPETITSDIDTSGWQTYRNEEYGFEFKYPEGWEIVGLDNTGVGLLPPWKKQNIEYNGDTRIFIRENVKHLSMQDFYNGQSMPNLFKYAIGGYKSIRTDNQKGIIFNKVLGLSTSDIVVIDFEDYFMEVEATDNFDIFRSIINTIKTK